MPTALHRPSVTPSITRGENFEPFTLDQELEPFGSWVGQPLLVPPKDSSDVFAETMLRETKPFASEEQRWATVVKKHRNDFTQVRELNLFEASIRLPKGRFFVTVTEQKDFDKITDKIPACVQTRLDEFLAGPGQEPGVKVYYLKPLCVEFGDELILTTPEDLSKAMAKVQAEAFAEYRRRALYRRPLQALSAFADVWLAAPRAILNLAVKRRTKVIDAYQAKLEFQRRKLALETARTHRKLRTDGCTFNEVLGMTSPLDRTDVIEQYCLEQELSRAKRDQLVMLAAGSIPWFVALSLTTSYLASVAVVTSTPPIVVCDPAFVAEMPGSNGVVLKIGHFDEVGGVTHIEI